jgi:hypothetical protein
MSWSAAKSLEKGARDSPPVKSLSLGTPITTGEIIVPIDLATAGAIAGAAKTAFDLIKSLLNDEIDSATMLRNIKNTIEQARDQIIQFMHSLLLDELQGNVIGLMITLEAYDPFPEGGGAPIPSEEERLRNLIDKGADVIGHLETTIRNQTALDLVFGSVPILAMVVSLRGAGMVERTMTYGINDLKDIPPMLRRGRDLLEVVRQKSDGRFGPIKIGRRTEPGFAAVGYVFDNRFQEIAEVRVNNAGVPTRLFPSFVSETRKRHMETAFQDIPGVTALSAFQLT